MEEQKDRREEQRRKEVAWLRLAGVALLLLVLLRLITCRAGAVEQARKRWEGKAISDYRIQLQEFHSLWCYYDVVAEVREGRVLTATLTAHYGPARSCGFYGDRVVEEPVAVSPEQAARWTVPSLFETAGDLESRVGQKGWKIDLAFDPDLGFPRRLAMDNEQAYDDDWQIVVIQVDRR